MERINNINKKIFNFIYYVLFVFANACDCPEKIPNTKDRLANKVLYQAAQDLKMEKSLYPCGSGGRMTDQIRMLALSFFYYKAITIEDGRELVVHAANKLAEKINAEPQIHPYLYKSPFSPTHVEIRIFIKNLDHSSMQEGVASIVSLIDGIIEYEVTDLKTDRLRTVYQETYAEGLEKLNHSLQAEKL